MKNKIELKKYITLTLIITLFLTIFYIFLHNYEYKIYTRNYNAKLSSIIELIKSNYHNVDETELIHILNSEKLTDTNILREYGINIETDPILLINKNAHNKFIIITTVYMIFSFIILLTIFLLYNKNKDKKITEITKLIEKINKKNYSLDIDSNTEDELSILKNEIYKTTILLKETAENSIKDKNNIKTSLEDISHQLKTPLTSIMINLDNIIDNPNMDETTKIEFIKNIQRETNSINFLVQSVLKLTKFETNNIEFKRENTKVSDIINESIKNVSALSDLKNINILVSGDTKIKINCDFKWQTEAITNILKNGIEHSSNNNEVLISFEENKLYVSIIIEDREGSLKQEEIPLIFKRFYKGENSTPDSIGIGLALAKEIIEQDEGRISVEVDPNVSTKFIIKYFKQ